MVRFDRIQYPSTKRYSICWRRERSMCSLCFSAGLFGLSNVPSAVKPSPSSSSTSPWTKKAGYTDSICCSKDNPVANCGTSGMIGYILIFYINIISLSQSQTEVLLTSTYFIWLCP